MIRYAVVGAGYIAQQAFLPAIGLTGNSAVTAIVSGSADRAQKLAAFYGAQHVATYDRYDELLKREDIDAVYIAVPNPLHAAYAIKAAQAGKHVLVEKPVATTVSDAETMIEAARANRVFLMGSYRLHHEPGNVAVLNAIQAGKIGDPRYFSAVFSFQSDQMNHRLEASQWSGPLPDVGIYCLNAARHVFAAEPVEVMAMAGSMPSDPRFTQIEACSSVLLRFPGDRLAHFFCSFGSAEVDSYRVIGSHGDLQLEPAFRLKHAMQLRINSPAGVENIQFPKTDHFAGLIQYFSDCILRNEAPEADGEEGLADLRVLLAIEESYKTGRPQRLSSPERSRHPVAGMVRAISAAGRRVMV
jgi:predicted dehydrogenase